jgi:predicted amidohydrolase
VPVQGAEGETFSAGAAAVTAGDVTGLGRTGLCVCFDGDFPETARSPRAAGAGVVLHPSAYEAAAESWWDTIYPAQALCNGQWWVSANQHGASQHGASQHGGAGGDRMLGGSRVIAPDGRVVVAAPRHDEYVPEPELN